MNAERCSFQKLNKKRLPGIERYRWIKNCLPGRDGVRRTYIIDQRSFDKNLIAYFKIAACALMFNRCQR